MSSAENFAFLLPLFLLTFGAAFLIAARWGSRPARMWGWGHIAIACAYAAPSALAGFRIEVQAVVSDALFLVAFFLFGQALLVRFDRPRYLVRQVAACLLVLAAIGYAVCVQASLRAELVLIDGACASLIAFPLLLTSGRVRHPVDRGLVGLSWLVVADILLRTTIFVASTGADVGLEGYIASSYAYFQQISSTLLGPVFALTALASVALDVLGTYRDAAENDPLTGLLNRRGFEQRAALALESGSGGSGAVVTCDIDHFKRVNDAFGHAAGDRVIAGLADLLRASLPKNGFAARFGGEEFVLFLPGHGEAEAVTFAEAVRLAFERHDWSGVGIAQPITASFGVARPASGDHSLHDAIARADKGLYAAKAAGRNHVMVEGRRRSEAPALRIVSAA